MMADKEERIEISKYDLNNKEWNGDTPIDIQKVYTRQEAIERIAKSLFKVDNVLALDIKWSQLKKSKQLVYKEFAEAALNALLENKK